MSFINDATKEAKRLPKAVWITAVIVPFGLAFIGAWIAGKSVYDNRKNNRKNKN